MATVILVYKYMVSCCLVQGHRNLNETKYDISGVLSDGEGNQGNQGGSVIYLYSKIMYCIVM